MKNYQKILNKYLAILSSTLILASASISVSAHPPKPNVPKVPEIDIRDSILDAEWDELVAAEKAKKAKAEAAKYEVDVTDSVLDAQLEELDAAEKKETDDFIKGLPKAHNADINAIMAAEKEAEKKATDDFIKGLPKANDADIYFGNKCYYSKKKNDIKLTKENIQNVKLKPNQQFYENKATGKIYIITDTTKEKKTNKYKKTNK